MTQHAVLIPARYGQATSQYQFNSDSHIALQALLEEHGEGLYVHFDIEVEEKPAGRVAFLLNDDALPNERAQLALAWLTDAHLKITGDACFSNLPAELVDYVATEKFV